jgi:hypothetical protein
MSQGPIITVEIMEEEGWRYMGQIRKEDGRWCWWIIKFPRQPDVSVGQEVVWGRAQSEQEARNTVTKKMMELTRREST